MKYIELTKKDGYLGYAALRGHMFSVNFTLNPPVAQGDIISFSNIIGTFRVMEVVKAEEKSTINQTGVLFVHGIDYKLP